MSFNKWKTVAMRKLIELSEIYKNDPKRHDTIEVLINKLRYLRSRDLNSFLYLLHNVAKDIPEVKDILPRQDEVEKMMERGE